MAKHTEAGVLYFNNPGNRPAGYTSQVLDPGSVTSLQTVSYINNRSGLKARSLTLTLEPERTTESYAGSGTAVTTGLRGVLIP